MTQLDLLKSFAQLFALCVEVDEVRKRVQFYSFGKLYRNIATGNVKDWSAKLDNRTHRHSFRWNSYGRQNIVKYKEDEDGAGAKLANQGSFTIDDHTLPPTKELFELPFAAGEDHRVGPLQLANLRLLKAGKVANEPKPKLVYVEKQEGKYVKYIGEKDKSGYPTYLESNNICIGNNTLTNIDYFIENEYKHLTHGLLKEVKIIVEKLLLTPIDLNKFNHAIPVYLHKYNCYFYVNKISNFITGKLTEIELLKIGSIS